ncbi:MAG: RdgB/HAM1 family non-canonical purine NTP pyrophosphatase [Cutibacterium avidum]|uniref:RdgB/HAM1 family non-canonical purine NTP pyrophosphatase n=1 Tax=Cutibacterium avidum TaxID=33010 RepID=UPI001C33289E|nr:RdgB/HAM1 family non-canonical purine NTP pyrophosphatase [Cutibacterium avidum]MBS5254305.1 RdgB/HAM1 family non-canonical purine NTP pyrophosphatase [Cutibacterium granulosum]MBS6260405.1 RdgB/HAM1 family non-canonical purine NTP pyrophosphatase [Propionibacterium sp.]MCO6662306.1 RdgB/HAM1 family non-canonical purine NTP pyrophosphatase [Cutibacterium avidum]MCO6666485.1 RdgB/HAM1 family non-canonical purine NTP pyrophosphatase [Cutibacterium avidum]MCO6681886.1 RdgB/HAM1 family non-cano
MSRIVLASNNPRKLVELRRTFESTGTPVEVVGLAEVSDAPAPAETGTTFVENALIKARAAARDTGLPALADDSGLEVDALNRMPGIRSARWSGPQANDERNLRLLLEQTFDLAPERRRGRFVCAMAFVDPDGTQITKVATMEGRVISEARGANGFGYDPMFVPDAQPGNLTSAEMTAEDKDAISHRGQAVRAIVPAVVAHLEGH